MEPIETIVTESLQLARMYVDESEDRCDISTLESPSTKGELND